MKENVRRLPSIRPGKHEVSLKNRPFFDPVFSQVCKCAKARCTRVETHFYKCANARRRHPPGTLPNSKNLDRMRLWHTCTPKSTPAPPSCRFGAMGVSIRVPAKRARRRRLRCCPLRDNWCNSCLFSVPVLPLHSKAPAISRPEVRFCSCLSN
jgi:hypothetical protein